MVPRTDKESEQNLLLDTTRTNTSVVRPFVDKQRRTDKTKKSITIEVTLPIDANVKPIAACTEVRIPRAKVHAQPPKEKQMDVTARRTQS